MAGLQASHISRCSIIAGRPRQVTAHSSLPSGHEQLMSVEVKLMAREDLR